MTAPRTDKLKAYFAEKSLSADGQPLPSFTVGTGSSSSLLRSAQITQGAGYWDGGIGFFHGNTITSALQGVFFHAKNSASNVVSLGKNLPAAPAPGDTFCLIAGGKWRSGRECMGQLVNSVLPEVVAVTGANITGLTIRRASPMLGNSGTLTIQYDSSAHTLKAKMGTAAYGTAVNASADLTDVTLFIGDGIGFVRVSTIASSLPGSTLTDSFSISTPKAVFTPDVENYESVAGSGGKIRYRLEIVVNDDPLTDMVDPKVYVDKPAGASTTIDTGPSLGLAAGTLNVVSAAGWPLSGFWIKNTTQNDCRYVFSRSGNALSVAPADWCDFTFYQGAYDILTPGTVLSSGGASFQVFRTQNLGGNFGNATGVGRTLANRVSGTISNGDTFYGTNATCRITGTPVRAMRGLNSVTWNTTDAVELMSDVDILIDRPSMLSPQFRDPAAEFDWTLFGLTFTHAAAAGSALSLGADLRPGEACGIWRREWIPNDARARDGQSQTSNFSWS